MLLGLPGIRRRHRKHDTNACVRATNVCNTATVSSSSWVELLGSPTYLKILGGMQEGSTTGWHPVNEGFYPLPAFALVLSSLMGFPMWIDVLWSLRFRECFGNRAVLKNLGNCICWCSIKGWMLERIVKVCHVAIYNSIFYALSRKSDFVPVRTCDATTL